MILSPVFDARFYDEKPPTYLIAEANFAVENFYIVLHLFSMRFFISVGGQPVTHSYVFDRMFGEFAAAAVVLAKTCHEKQSEDIDDGNGEHRVTYEMLRERIEAILHDFLPDVLPYYSRCVGGLHKHFVWTGPKVDIFPRMKPCDAIVLKPLGELQDLPSHTIYASPEDLTIPTTIHFPATPPATIPPATSPATTIPPAANPPPGKRHDREDSVGDAGQQRKKRRI